MPKSATSDAATSSCVLSGFEPHRNTSAPPACSVRARFAVSVVTCRQAAMRMPRSGRSFAKRARIARSTGMLRSAHSMRMRPSRASRSSFTWPATAWPFACARPFFFGDAMESPSRNEVERVSLRCAEDCARAERAAQLENHVSTRRSLMSYAFAYETDHVDPRRRVARRTAPPRGGGGPHAHVRGRARVAPGARRGPGAALPRRVAVLRPGPVPRRSPHGAGPRRARGGIVIAVDTSVLAFAVNRFAPEHARCARVLERLAESDRPWGLPWSVVGEFLALVTHPHAVARALQPADALAFVDELLATPGARALSPGPGHAAALREALAFADPAPGLPPGFETAALLREHGVRELLSADAGMKRFAF